MSLWQYLGHVEPVQQIPRDLRVPWLPSCPDQQPARGGFITALAVAMATIVIPTPVQAANLSWAQPLSVPVATPLVVDATTGAEWTPRTIFRQAIPWAAPLDQPTPLSAVVITGTGGERPVPAPAAVRTLAWFVSTAVPVVVPVFVPVSMGADQPVVRIPTARPILWYVPLAMPTLPTPPMLYGSGAELKAVTVPSTDVRVRRMANWRNASRSTWRW